MAVIAGQFARAGDQVRPQLGAAAPKRSVGLPLAAELDDIDFGLGKRGFAEEHEVVGTLEFDPDCGIRREEFQSCDARSAYGLSPRVHGLTFERFRPV